MHCHHHHLPLHHHPGMEDGGKWLTGSLEILKSSLTQSRPAPSPIEGGNWKMINVRAPNERHWKGLETPAAWPRRKAPDGIPLALPWGGEEANILLINHAFSLKIIFCLSLVYTLRRGWLCENKQKQWKAALFFLYHSIYQSSKIRQSVSPRASS